MSAEQQQAGQHVEACLTHDAQKEEWSEANTNEPVLVITIPSITNNEQKADEIILDLPDTFTADCSPHIDDNLSKLQDFNIFCNDLQSCNDETMPHYNPEVTV